MIGWKHPKAPVAQGIEQWPPEPCAQVRILPGAQSRNGPLGPFLLCAACRVREKDRPSGPTVPAGGTSARAPRGPSTCAIRRVREEDRSSGPTVPAGGRVREEDRPLAVRRLLPGAGFGRRTAPGTPPAWTRPRTHSAQASLRQRKRPPRSAPDRAASGSRHGR